MATWKKSRRQWKASTRSSSEPTTAVTATARAALIETGLIKMAPTKTALSKMELAKAEPIETELTKMESNKMEAVAATVALPMAPQPMARLRKAMTLPVAKVNCRLPVLNRWR